MAPVGMVLAETAQGAMAQDAMAPVEMALAEMAQGAMAPAGMVPSALLDRMAMAQDAMAQGAMAQDAMAPAGMVLAEMAQGAMAQGAMALVAMTVRNAAPSGFRRRRRKSSPQPVGSVVEKPSWRVRASRFWCGGGSQERRASHWFTIAAITRTKPGGCRRLAPLRFDVSRPVTNTIGAVVAR
jgi:hypothetical protein